MAVETVADVLRPFESRMHELDAPTLKRLKVLLKEAQKVEKRTLCQTDFLEFVRAMWPIFIEGAHHRIMAKKFEAMIDDDLKRLTISMPPRFGKSELSSVLLPAWALGKHPDWKIIMASHTAELAVGFGRKVRNLIDSKDYQEIFPGVSLQVDSKAAGRWSTNKGGEYYAVGVGGALAGKGADLCVVDDSISEQEGMSVDPKVFAKVNDWFTSGPRQRLQPGGRIAIIGTRWSKIDVIGYVIKTSIEREGSQEWDVINFPAILDEGTDDEKALWPAYWPLEEMQKLRAELPVNKWMAQYQQTPTSESGAIIKRAMWQEWGPEKAPKCDYVIQSWDTAYLKTQRSDFSACTTWGVFQYTDPDTGIEKPNIILLDAFRERLEFPDLKARAKSEYMERTPDTLLIESKASGWPLIFELRAMGIPVQDFGVGRGKRFAPNDKVARLNAVSDLFHSKVVWAPKRRYAEMVIEEMAEFPVSEHDDLVDASVMALQRFRDGGFVGLPTDWEPAHRNPVMATAEGYY